MSQKKNNVSMSVIRRLPRYFRFLTELEKKGVSRISSRELAGKMGITASQIRQDLNCFGGFGQQGYGYTVPPLKDEIKNILGLNHKYSCILIGAGNLGRAVASHMNFEQRGFVLQGIFDKSDKVIGNEIQGLKVQDVAQVFQFCAEHHPMMAILCLPQESVKHLCGPLVEAGIRCFWNFSHYDISAKYPDTIVENVHMSDSLMTLCYRIQDSEEQE